MVVSRLVVLLAAVVCLCSALTVAPHDTTKIKYQGRVAFSDPKVVQYDWSGVSYSIRFTNTTVLPLVLLQDVKNMYNIYVTAVGTTERTSILKTNHDSTVKKYDLGHAVPLDRSKTYTLQVEKRTEASFGSVKFSGFEFTQNAVVLAPEVTKRLKMEFIGDSITCGYGAEGKAPCHFSASTENNHYSYAAIAARALDAEYNIVSWSGKGMVRNYGDKQLSPEPVPYFYDRTVANNPKLTWNFTSYVPDIVVINLGTNDFSVAAGKPSEAQFSKGYNAFLDRVKHNYGSKVKIFCMSGPVKIPYTPQIVAARKDSTIKFADVQNVLTKTTDWGCDGHPSVQGATKMGTILAEIIKKDM